MKFLVLAMCVCAASAASLGYKPWQPVQQAVATAAVTAPKVAEIRELGTQPSSKAVASAVVTAPEVVATKIYEPVVKSAVYVDKNSEAAAAILRSDSDVTADSFNFVYETANGIAAQSTGALKKLNDGVALAIQGQYRYTAPDGTPVEFSYVADENGYQPQSNVLPVGPAIPEAILRSLEYIRTHPQPVKKN